MRSLSSSSSGDAELFSTRCCLLLLAASWRTRQQRLTRVDWSPVWNVTSASRHRDQRRTRGRSTSFAVWSCEAWGLHGGRAQPRRSVEMSCCRNSKWWSSPPSLRRPADRWYARRRRTDSGRPWPLGWAGRWVVEWWERESDKLRIPARQRPAYEWCRPLKCASTNSTSIIYSSSSSIWCRPLNWRHHSTTTCRPAEHVA